MMKRKKYSVEIEVLVEKAYDFMLGLTNKSTYEQWTAIFNPTSTYEGSWEKGSKIRFVGTSENGKKSGMVARIAEHIPYKYVSIEHYGLFEGDTEITEGPQVETWAGGQENYTFEKSGDSTTLSVEVDVTDEHEYYFNSTYPNALQKLKELVETA